MPPRNSDLRNAWTKLGQEYTTQITSGGGIWVSWIKLNQITSKEISVMPVDRNVTTEARTGIGHFGGISSGALVLRAT